MAWIPGSFATALPCLCGVNQVTLSSLPSACNLSSRSNVEKTHLHAIPSNQQRKRPTVLLDRADGRRPEAPFALRQLFPKRLYECDHFIGLRHILELGEAKLGDRRVQSTVRGLVEGNVDNLCWALCDGLDDVDEVMVPRSGEEIVKVLL